MSPRQPFQDITVSALNIGGWFDGFLRGTMRCYEGMRQQGTTALTRQQQHLLIGLWHPHPTRFSLSHRDLWDWENAFSYTMDIVSSQPIGTGDDDPVQRGLFEPIPQAIQPRPIEGGATIAIITENILRAQSLTLAGYVRGEARNLLFNRLCQRLTLGRHAGIDGRSHTCLPSVVCAGV